MTPNAVKMQTSAKHGRLARLWLARPALRSLTLKLTLAFLCVGLIGALLVALFVSLRTRRAFDQFVADNNRASLITNLESYYKTNGSWNGVRDKLIADRISQATTQAQRIPLVLLDANGVVVLGGSHYTPGARVSTSELPPSAVPILVDGKTTGWLVNEGRRPGPGTPEADLLGRITQAITYSAVGAVALALLLGVLLARTLTQPLRELTAATEVVAKGALGQQVTVHSRDELGTLARAFNRMSADLAHASTLRKQMTADIAHDLRTPLSVILGYTEALRDGKLPGTQDIYDTMYTEAQHLQHLIDDLRTLSLADAGELALMRQLVAPEGLLERAAAAARSQTESRHIVLDLRLPEMLPLIDVDPERIAQVLGNLLSNALRYTPAGGTITLTGVTQGDFVHLTVQDSGVGIAPDDLPHIFERFYRADPSRQLEDGSSGLGLAIARSIVEAHGGTLTAESVLGQGATFIVSLPAASDTMAAATLPPPDTDEVQLPI